MNELVFLGDCPVIKPEGIYIDGHRVIRFGMNGVGLGDVGDLLAYRQAWEPFIQAHLALWREMNELLESAPEARKCPPGIFGADDIANLPPATQSFCASLALTRINTSSTHPLGILPQWNAWKGKSSAEILAGADTMLKWHLDVVMLVGTKYAEELLKIAKTWNIAIKLPDLPTFSVQQDIISRIEGAYVATKGILGIVGYGPLEMLKLAGSTTQAVAEGLADTAKAIPKAVASPVTWIGITAVVALIGGALLIYYVPRRT